MTAGVAAVVYLLHGFDAGLSRDLGVYAYAGQRFADGVPPYDGVLNRSGPLSHLLPGVAIWAGRRFGVDDLLAARVFFLLLAVASVYAVHALGREVLGSRWAGAVAGFTLITYGGYIALASGGPREKTPMVLLLALALVTTLQRRWWWAGLWISLGTLTWQPVFFPAIAAALVGLLLVEERGRRLRGLVALAVSGLLPLAAFLAWYAARGELQYFLDCFVLIHVEYTQQFGALQNLSFTWEVLAGGYHHTVWILLGSLAAAAVAPLVVAAWPRLRRSREGRAVLVTGAATVGSLAWSYRAFNGWPDAFVVMPTAALGTAFLLWPLWRLLPRPAVGVATAVVAGLAYAVATHYALTTRSEELLGQRARAEAVAAIVGPDATFLSLQAPQGLVLSGKVNPIREQMFDNGLVDYVAATWPGGLTGFNDWIVEQRPTVLVVQPRLVGTWLDPVLTEDYRRCGRADHVVWLLLRDADPTWCEQVSAVLATAPE
ncbi:MAG: hypothetical protein R2731_05455 [Nocardioides sp.]